MALRLDLEFGANDAFRGLDRLISGMRSLEGTVKELTMAFRGVQSGGSSAAADIDRTARAARGAVGPMERLARAKSALAEAEKSGNSSQVFDAKFALAKAQKGVDRADAVLNPTGKNGIADLIGTSRLAIGPNGKLQMMPLVNRMMASGLLKGGQLGGMLNLSAMGGGIGGGGMAGGAGLAAAGPIAAAAAAALMLAASARMAAQNIIEFSKAQYTAGGSGTQTAQLMRMSAALGIDAPGKARAFGESIWSNGIAKGFASSLGINTNGGPFGNLNDAQKYLQAVKAISDPKRMGDEQAMRFARAFGLEDELLLRKASPGVRDMALGTMDRSLSPAEQQLAADNAVRFNLALYDVTLTLRDIGTAVLPVVNDSLKSFKDWLDNMSGKNKTDPFRDAATDMPSRLLPGPVGQAFGRLLDWEFNGIGWKRNNGATDHDSVTSDHTRAMGEHTKAMRESVEFIGGGKNIKGAIPSAWRYQIMQQGLHGAAVGMGGAGLGAITL